MTKKTRIILFLICLSLFIIITPLAILYSQGYRIDMENKKITQTGGIFLRVLPKQAGIYINGKLNKRTDFFFGSVLIENLLPQKYKVEIKKEGYHPWQKTLEIEEKTVAEIKDIILFPENIDFEILSKNAEESWFLPEQKKIILKKREEDGWFLQIYDLGKDIESMLVKQELFDKDSQLINLEFSQDSEKIYLEIKTAEQIKYFEQEINQAEALFIETTFLLPPIENAIAYSDIYYLGDSGELFENRQKITLEPFPVKKETKYRLEIVQDFIFLLEEDKSSSSNNLYRFNPDLESFEIFFEKISGFKKSPDSKKLAYFSDHEIWILFLNDTGEPFRKNKGESMLLIRLSEKIDDFFWLNNNYLVFSAGETIKVSEVNNRNGLNVIDLLNKKNLSQINQGESLIADSSSGQDKIFSKIFWNQADKKLYVLSEKILYRSNVFLP